MPGKKIKAVKRMFAVEIWEHDNWSGPELIDTKYYVREGNANNFVKKYNNRNTSKVVPEYYTVAHPPQEVMVRDGNFYRKYNNQT